MKKYKRLFFIIMCTLLLVSSCTTFRAHLGELHDAEIEISRSE